MVILKEGSMIVLCQGIMDDLPPFEIYCTHMFQNKSMPVFGDFQSKVFPFARLCNVIFSPEYDTKK